LLERLPDRVTAGDESSRQSQADPPSAERPPNGITIRIRRVHLWALGALAAGLVAGFLIARATEEDPQPVLYGLPPADSPVGQTPAVPGSSPAAPTEPVDVDASGQPARGPEDAPVTMVEFVDFECPFCGSFARETLPRIEREYGDRIRYVSMNFPLQIHEHAEHAARAAECAFAQDRYWEYHAELFDNQDSLAPPDLSERAERVGLDTDAFEACMRSNETRQLVAEDADAGRDYGVSATPTFFINGTPLNGAQPYGQFKAALDAALDEAG
jgi:protein-disulfide isomerase